jgi:asparagine synthase (glutamine-hydrolysing)
MSMSYLAGLAQKRFDPGIRDAFSAMRGDLQTLDAFAREPHRSQLGQLMVACDAQRVTTGTTASGTTVILAGTPWFDGASTAVGAGDVLERYTTAGTAFTDGIEGSFAICLVDEERGLVVLVSDATGSLPLYWANGSRFAFAASLRAVCAALESGPDLDLRAAADYIHYGVVLGEKTLAAGVSLVPAGTTLTYDRHDGTVRMAAHTRPASFFDRREDDRHAYLQKVTGAFGAAVARACADAPALGLSLSGGLDSRAILSAIPPASRPVRTYTVGVRLCADDVIAGKLSRLAGTAHYFLELGDEYLRDFLPNLERMVALTDGMYLSHGLTEMLALRAVEASGIRTLLRGHLGELAKSSLAWPFHTDAAIESMNGRDPFADYFFSRVNYVSAGVDPVDLFTSDLRAEVRGAARRSLDEALEEAPDLSPPDLCSYLYLTQHHRRCTIPSIELFRAGTDVRQPFADDRFLKALLGGRSEWRTGTDIHRHITAQNDRRLLAVRNSNTGAPGSAPAWLDRMMDPVNSVLKKLNAPGYRHYHQLDVWMRRQLLASVQDVLFDGGSLARGLYNMTTLQRLVDETKTGAADRAHLLQLLLVLELWQRQSQRVAA